MTAFRARGLLFAFLLILGGVAVNAMYLQDKAPRWKDVTLLSPDAVPRVSPAKPKVRRVRRVLPRWNPNVSLSPQPASAGHDAVAGSQPDRTRDPSLKPASSADRRTVRALQRELASRGYEPGPVDGIPGIMTRAAIMAYEHDERLPLTAVPTSALLERVVLGGIGRSGDVRATRTGEQAQLIIRSVQAALSRLGYAPGASDGFFNDTTARAIRAFERDHGLVPSGRISGRLIGTIQRVDGARFRVAARW